MPGTPQPRLVTVVVGAGPAGLLFCIVARILAEQAGLAEAWALRLIDKRASYVRSHRLRMDRAAYVALGESLRDPRFDALLTFLHEARFAPEVNRLEERLGALARELGIEKRLRAVGDGDGELSLRALRADLESDLAPLTMLTVVGADSVHSAVRRLAAAGAPPIRQKHEQLARLRVRGTDLPEHLGPADQLRISKLLGSLVDYRLNSNGFAEVDLFLTAAEHARVRDLGAAPTAPVTLDEEALRRLDTPPFAGIWQAQLSVVFLGGVAITVVASLAAGELTHPLAALWSLRLAAAFLAGLYLFEAISARVARAAALDEVGR